MRATTLFRLSALAGACIAFVLACSHSNDPSPSNNTANTTSSSSGGATTAPTAPPVDHTQVPNTGPVLADPPIDTSGLDPVVNPKAPACTGAAGSLYNLQVPPLVGTDAVPLCRGQGRVLLIVNSASHCGYTPQYKPLEALYTKHKDAGFSILAFPSTSFNQEDTDAATVSEFCTQENGITFPLFAIDIVAKDSPKAGDVAQPVYQWLYAQPGYATQVAWNFEKFLISKKGQVVGRWLSADSPDDGGDIDLAVQAELAKPTAQ